MTTAIWKEPVGGRVEIRGFNLAGDDQADRRVHGGPRKAIYAYALEDLEWWSAQLGRETPPGVFGENLTTAGIDLNQALVGERWRIGSAVVEVTEARMPCQKLGMRMGDQKFPKRFAAAERPGAYLGVVEEGSVAAGDELKVVFRPQHPVSLALLAHLNHTDKKLAALMLAAAEAGLSEQEWEFLAAQALAQ